MENKSSIYLILFLLTTSNLIASGTHEMPIKLESNHYKNYPGSKMTSWKSEISEDVFIIHFAQDDVKYIAQYNENFKRIAEQVNLSKSDLSPSILSFLNNKYGKFKFISIVKAFNYDQIEKNFEHYKISVKTKIGNFDEYLDEKMNLNSVQ